MKRKIKLKFALYRLHFSKRDELLLLILLAVLFILLTVINSVVINKPYLYSWYTDEIAIVTLRLSILFCLATLVTALHYIKRIGPWKG